MKIIITVMYRVCKEISRVKWTFISVENQKKKHLRIFWEVTVLFYSTLVIFYNNIHFTKFIFKENVKES